MNIREIGIEAVTPPEVMPEVVPEAETKEKEKHIGTREIESARARFEEFRAAKAPLDAATRENEEWYRLRHMQYVDGSGKTQRDYFSGEENAKGVMGSKVEPTSALLLNSIKNKHADAMANYPRANVLPREEADEAEAYKLSKIIPSLLERIKFERTYSDMAWSKPVQGWGVYAVFWDKDAEDGVGEIGIEQASLLNLYFDMEENHIQKSSDVFYVHMVRREDLKRNYPEIPERELEAVGTGDGEYERYNGNPTNATQTKVPVIDWYYKKRNKQGRRVVHLCQFVGDIVLFSSEDTEEWGERGIYDHGKYPFVVDVLYPYSGQIAGFGEVATGKAKQTYIDILQKATVKNALWQTNPRYFFSSGSGVNKEDFANVNNMVVEVTSLTNGSVQRIDTAPLSGNVLALADRMVGELKETTGAKDVATGAAPGGGVTAASAIASLQEAAGKGSRDFNRGSYAAFREVIEMVIELIRQFYTDERHFRVLGEGERAYMTYTSDKLREGGRHPLFDLEITTERASNYTRMQNNQLALELYGAGFFTPGNAPAALACLDIMDFDQKEEVISIIHDNDMRQKQIQALGEQAITLASVVDELYAKMGQPSNFAEQFSSVVGNLLNGNAAGQAPVVQKKANIDTSHGGSITEQARQGAAEVASPT